MQGPAEMPPQPPPAETDTSEYESLSCSLQDFGVFDEDFITAPAWSRYGTEMPYDGDASGSGSHTQPAFGTEFAASIFSTPPRQYCQSSQAMPDGIPPSRYSGLPLPQLSPREKEPGRAGAGRTPEYRLSDGPPLRSSCIFTSFVLFIFDILFMFGIFELSYISSVCMFL